MAGCGKQRRWKVGLKNGNVKASVFVQSIIDNVTSELLVKRNDHSVPTKVLAITRYMNEKMTQPLYLCKIGWFCLLTILCRNGEEEKGQKSGFLHRYCM